MQFSLTGPGQSRLPWLTATWAVYIFFCYFICSFAFIWWLTVRREKGVGHVGESPGWMWFYGVHLNHGGRERSSQNPLRKLRKIMIKKQGRSNLLRHRSLQSALHQEPVQQSLLLLKYLVSDLHSRPRSWPRADFETHTKRQRLYLTPVN